MLVTIRLVAESNPRLMPGPFTNSVVHLLPSTNRSKRVFPRNGA